MCANGRRCLPLPATTTTAAAAATTVLLITLLPAAVLPTAQAAGLNGHVVTAAWHAKSTPYKNYFDPHLKMASFYDPAWMSTSKDTATNIFVGPGVEFGWGKDAGHSVTLDMHDDGRLVLALHCAGSHDECSFEDAHMTVTSTAFTGASLSLTGSTLSGRISMASLHAQDGILEIKLHDLKITTNGQTQTQTCEFVIVQPSACTTGECCDVGSGKPKQAGTVCRPAAHPCDIVEMCDGFSAVCPTDHMTTDAAHCDRPVQGPKGSDKKEFLYNDKRAAAAPSYADAPAEDDEEAVPQHEDIHGPEGVLYAHPNTQRSGSLRLNYLGLAAVACVILWLVLKDKLGGNKAVTSPGRLPAHHRAGRRW